MCKIVPEYLTCCNNYLTFVPIIFTNMPTKRVTRRKKKEMLSEKLVAFAKKPDVDDLITVQEAARIRSVSGASIFQLIARRRIRSEKVIGRTLVYRTEIENFVRFPRGFKGPE